MGILKDKWLLLRRNMIAVVIILLLSHFSFLTAQKPITIVCDWDFAPYEYFNGEGKSDGFNIEVLNTILNDLEIPHRFIMGARNNTVETFRNHQADLIIDYSQRFVGEPYYRTVNSLEYNTMAIAFNKDTPPLTKVEQLKGVTIAVVGINDTIVRTSLFKELKDAKIKYHTARDALGNIETGKLKYFVWGKELIEWRMREYNLTNIIVEPLDIPATEINIVGYDKELIEDIDNQFARLQQSGKIDIMRDKWFHPERVAQRTSPVVRYVILGVLLLSLLIYAIYRITKARVRKALQRNSVTEAMMRQALNMGNYSVIINNLRQNRVSNQHGHAVPDEGITMKQMMEKIHPEDREMMKNRRSVMERLKGQPHPFTLRWNKGTKDTPEWSTITGYSYPELDIHKKPMSIVIVSRDITDDMRKEQEIRELTNRYIKMFDSSLLAMSFYDKDGHLINLNENMKKLCGLTDESLKFFWATSFFDIDIMKGDFDPKSHDLFHVCQRMLYPDIGIDKYVELSVNPITNDKGSLVYYVVTGRDVSEERTMYLELQRQRKDLNETSEKNMLYEKELRTLLENCNMYVWHADPMKKEIYFSRSQHGEEFKETFDEYLEGMEETHRQQAMVNIEHIADIKGPYLVVHRFNHTPVTDKPAWFSVSGMPILDENGNLKSHFGLVRDITNLMEAQERLKEETARAENSAMLKSTFLANMTHEIRTPLNAIVGFSDLLQTIEGKEERKEFISIIRNNCDMLMRLINDIFEASTMDIKPLAIVPRRVDFAKEFNVVCQSLAQRVQNPDVKFIADQPFDTLITTLDMGRMQQVITNFVTNAVKYTHKGHIRVGYCMMTEDKIPGHPLTTSQQSPGLYIFCEDTGTGIPKNKQARVFDRFVKLNDFVQGTGLGLAICKSIAQRCGGCIGLNSEGEGKGSTFWIWVPCTQISN